MFTFCFLFLFTFSTTSSLEFHSNTEQSNMQYWRVAGLKFVIWTLRNAFLSSSDCLVTFNIRRFVRELYVDV